MDATALSVYHLTSTRNAKAPFVTECKNKQKLLTHTNLIANVELLEYHVLLHRAYTFTADEVVITNLNDNRNGELEMTMYAYMNDETAVLPKDTLTNAVQVLVFSALIG